LDTIGLDHNVRALHLWLLLLLLLLSLVVVAVMHCTVQCVQALFGRRALLSPKERYCGVTTIQNHKRLVFTASSRHCIRRSWWEDGQTFQGL
jgi:hypothetical protein